MNWNTEIEIFEHDESVDEEESDVEDEIDCLTLYHSVTALGLYYYFCFRHCRNIFKIFNCYVLLYVFYSRDNFEKYKCTKNKVC